MFVYEKKSSFIDVIYAKGTKDVLAILISKSDISDILDLSCPYVGSRLILSGSYLQRKQKLERRKVEYKTFSLLLDDFSHHELFFFETFGSGSDE